MGNDPRDASAHQDHPTPSAPRRPTGESRSRRPDIPARHPCRLTLCRRHRCRPPVHAAMARPAQQLDVASALPPKAGVGPMVDRDRRRASTVQDQRPSAPGAAPVARHEPPPPPRPPHRRAEIQLIQQRVPPTHAHEPSSGPGRSAQSAPIARKATASSGAARGRRPADILNDGGRFRSSAPNRSDPPHSPVTPEVAGSSPVAPAPTLPGNRSVCAHGRRHRFEGGNRAGQPFFPVRSILLIPCSTHSWAGDGLEGRHRTGSTPAGGGVGSAGAPRGPLRGPLPGGPDEARGCALGGTPLLRDRRPEASRAARRADPARPTRACRPAPARRAHSRQSSRPDAAPVTTPLGRLHSSGSGVAEPDPDDSSSPNR